MKLYTILLMGLFAALFGCGKKSSLTEGEIQSCKTLFFDQSLIEKIKKETNSAIGFIPQINEYGEVLKETGNGLCSKIAEQEGLVFVANNKKKFMEKGYLLFVFEDDNHEYYLATMKSDDEFDMLKWRQTNGINHDLENKDVIAKLEAWKSKYDFIILGVGMDWLQLKFTATRPDFDAFANEVYEFCPDIVDQGAGDIPTLAKELKGINGVYLWWD